MNLLQQLSVELERLVAEIEPAVVGIEHAKGHGTGFVLAPDGHLLTNHHVVGRRRTVRVHCASGRRPEGDVVGVDPATDLAVVRIPAADLVGLPLAENRELNVGQLVLAIGNPFRFEQSVSLGVISALDRTLATPDGNVVEGVIQTDAAINPGNSGGPLVNAWGKVVGVTTAIVPYAQGIGFAVPAQTARWVANLLIEQGRVDRRYLGIAAKAAHLTRELAGELDQTRAVRVLAVAPGSPAAAAGLEEGDLLLGVEGTALEGVGDLQRLLATTGDRAVRLHVRRRGERLDIHARPSRRRAA